ncbi:hypothetical protein [Bradyrhizobium japonicum]|uniref:hypothetical protein n=1 Tax=Bradyrhizobium japonicum TaxID=375 RepID=UPI001E2D998E|nr:hypothetical protein [Bradyrhizobium japonicum]MCD9821625.1 hypothetical protein [Bradyrhizobium japonicum]MEB2678416.1 hypothetical protein [Bradyrhizobium japonicum]WRI88652.1 hypothetical protein R3F75_43670 [Bradyrhizobium japonicum]
MAKQPDKDWRRSVIEMMSPTMEANAGTGGATGFQPAAPSDFGPIIFRGNRTPDDAAALLPDAAATKAIAIEQRAADLFAAVPTFEEVQEVRLEVIGYKNRISDLTRHRSEGGFEQDPSAPQVLSEKRKLERAEKELARRTELKEVRTVRSTVAAQLRQSVNDWVLRGVPGDCTLDVVEDQPLSELLTKADGGRIETAVERFRLKLREGAADLHRVRSSPWSSSAAKVAAKGLIDRLADQGQPNLDAAIEHGMDIVFATTRLQSLVYNAQPRAVAYAEVPDVLALMCWVLRDQLLAKINAGFDEIADDKQALDQRQREEAEAQIGADMLAAERAECALIWHAAAKDEVIDFRPTTSPQAVLGVALRTVPRAPSGPSSPEIAGYTLIGGR